MVSKCSPSPDESYDMQHDLPRSLRDLDLRSRSKVDLSRSFDLSGRDKHDGAISFALS